MPALPPPHHAALRRLAADLRASDVLWAVTGSAGFALQGVPVEVHDLDVQTDAAGAYEIERRFSAHVTRPVRYSAAERIRSHFGALHLGGVAVEIMGDIQKRLPDGSWEVTVPLSRHLRWVALGDLEIPVPSLAYETLAYRLLGRLDKASLLETWLGAAHPDAERRPST